MYMSSSYGTNWFYRTQNGFTIVNTRFLVISSNSTYSLMNDSTNLIISKTNILTSFSFNLDTGSTFFLTGLAPTANYTANFTITLLDTTRCYYITLINNTSSVASYYCTAITINGTSIVSPRFLYNRPISLVGAVQTNQEFILFYNTTATAWFALTTIKVLTTA